MKFTEEKLEKAFTELLGLEGFPHHLGSARASLPQVDLGGTVHDQFVTNLLTCFFLKSHEHPIQVS